MEDPPEDCRTCLKSPSSDSTFYSLDCIDVIFEVSLKEQLNLCVPELNLDHYTFSICFSCKNALRNAYEFKIMCLENEKQILDVICENKYNPPSLCNEISDNYSDISIVKTEHPPTDFMKKDADNFFVDDEDLWLRANGYFDEFECSDENELKPQLPPHSPLFNTSVKNITESSLPLAEEEIDSENCENYYSLRSASKNNVRRKTTKKKKSKTCRKCGNKFDNGKLFWTHVKSESCPARVLNKKDDNQQLENSVSEELNVNENKSQDSDSTNKSIAQQKDLDNAFKSFCDASNNRNIIVLEEDFENAFKTFCESNKMNMIVYEEDFENAFKSIYDSQTAISLETEENEFNDVETESTIEKTSLPENEFNDVGTEKTNEKNSLPENEFNDVETESTNEKNSLLESEFNDVETESSIEKNRLPENEFNNEETEKSNENNSFSENEFNDVETESTNEKNILPENEFNDVETKNTNEKITLSHIIYVDHDYFKKTKFEREKTFCKSGSERRKKKRCRNKEKEKALRSLVEKQSLEIGEGNNFIAKNSTSTRSNVKLRNSKKRTTNVSSDKDLRTSVSDSTILNNLYSTEILRNGKIIFVKKHCGVSDPGITDEIDRMLRNLSNDVEKKSVEESNNGKLENKKKMITVSSTESRDKISVNNPVKEKLKIKRRKTYSNVANTTKEITEHKKMKNNEQKILRVYKRKAVPGKEKNSDVKFNNVQNSNNNQTVNNLVENNVNEINSTEEQTAISSDVPLDTTIITTADNEKSIIESKKLVSNEITENNMEVNLKNEEESFNNNQIDDRSLPTDFSPKIFQEIKTILNDLTSVKTSNINDNSSISFVKMLNRSEAEEWLFEKTSGKNNQQSNLNVVDTSNCKEIINVVGKELVPKNTDTLTVQTNGHNPVVLDSQQSTLNAQESRTFKNFEKNDVIYETTPTTILDTVRQTANSNNALVTIDNQLVTFGNQSKPDISTEATLNITNKDISKNNSILMGDDDELIGEDLDNLMESSVSTVINELIDKLYEDDDDLTEKQLPEPMLKEERNVHIISSFIINERNTETTTDCLQNSSVDKNIDCPEIIDLSLPLIESVTYKRRKFKRDPERTERKRKKAEKIYSFSEMSQKEKNRNIRERMIEKRRNKGELINESRREQKSTNIEDRLAAATHNQCNKFEINGKRRERKVFDSSEEMYKCKYYLLTFENKVEENAFKSIYDTQTAISLETEENEFNDVETESTIEKTSLPENDFNDVGTEKTNEKNILPENEVNDEETEKTNEVNSLPENEFNDVETESINKLNSLPENEFNDVETKNTNETITLSHIIYVDHDYFMKKKFEREKKFCKSGSRRPKKKRRNLCPPRKKSKQKLVYRRKSKRCRNKEKEKALRSLEEKKSLEIAEGNNSIVKDSTTFRSNVKLRNSKKRTTNVSSDKDLRTSVSDSTISNNLYSNEISTNGQIPYVKKHCGVSDPGITDEIDRMLTKLLNDDVEKKSVEESNNGKLENENQIIAVSSTVSRDKISVNNPVKEKPKIKRRKTYSNVANTTKEITEHKKMKNNEQKNLRVYKRKAVPGKEKNSEVYFNDQFQNKEKDEALRSLVEKQSLEIGEGNNSIAKNSTSFRSNVKVRNSKKRTTNVSSVKDLRTSLSDSTISDNLYSNEILRNGKIIFVKKHCGESDPGITNEIDRMLTNLFNDDVEKKSFEEFNNGKLENEKQMIAVPSTKISVNNPVKEKPKIKRRKTYRNVANTTKEITEHRKKVQNVKNNEQKILKVYQRKAVPGKEKKSDVYFNEQFQNEEKDEALSSLVEKQSPEIGEGINSIAKNSTSFRSNVKVQNSKKKTTDLSSGKDLRTSVSDSTISDNLYSNEIIRNGQITYVKKNCGVSDPGITDEIDGMLTNLFNDDVEKKSFEEFNNGKLENEKQMISVPSTKISVNNPVKEKPKIKRRKTYSNVANTTKEITEHRKMVQNVKNNEQKILRVYKRKAVPGKEKNSDVYFNEQFQNEEKDEALSSLVEKQSLEIGEGNNSIAKNSTSFRSNVKVQNSKKRTTDLSSGQDLRTSVSDSTISDNLYSNEIIRNGQITYVKKNCGGSDPGITDEIDRMLTNLFNDDVEKKSFEEFNNGKLENEKQMIAVPSTKISVNNPVKEKPKIKRRKTYRNVANTTKEITEHKKMVQNVKNSVQNSNNNQTVYNLVENNINEINSTEEQTAISSDVPLDTRIITTADNEKSIIESKKLVSNEITENNMEVNLKNEDESFYNNQTVINFGEANVNEIQDSHKNGEVNDASLPKDFSPKILQEIKTILNDLTSDKTSNINDNSTISYVKILKALETNDLIEEFMNHPIADFKISRSEAEKNLKNEIFNINRKIKDVLENQSCKIEKVEDEIKTFLKWLFGKISGKNNQQSNLNVVNTSNCKEIININVVGNELVPKNTDIFTVQTNRNNPVVLDSQQSTLNAQESQTFKIFEKNDVICEPTPTTILDTVRQTANSNNALVTIDNQLVTFGNQSKPDISTEATLNITNKDISKNNSILMGDDDELIGEDLDNLMESSVSTVINELIDKLYEDDDDLTEKQLPEPMLKEERNVHIISSFIINERNTETTTDCLQNSAVDKNVDCPEIIDLSLPLIESVTNKRRKFKGDPEGTERKRKKVEKIYSFSEMSQKEKNRNIRERMIEKRRNKGELINESRREQKSTNIEERLAADTHNQCNKFEINGKRRERKVFDSSEEIYKCKYCSLTFENKVSKKNHKNTVTHKKKVDLFKLTMTNSKMSFLKSIREPETLEETEKAIGNIRNKIKMIKKYNCEACLDSFVSKSQLERHKKSHVYEFIV